MEQQWKEHNLISDWETACVSDTKKTDNNYTIFSIQKLSKQGGLITSMVEWTLLFIIFPLLF